MTSVSWVKLSLSHTHTHTQCGLASCADNVDCVFREMLIQLGNPPVEKAQSGHSALGRSLWQQTLAEEPTLPAHLLVRSWGHQGTPAPMCPPKEAANACLAHCLVSCEELSKCTDVSLETSLQVSGKGRDCDILRKAAVPSILPWLRGMTHAELPTCFSTSQFAQRCICLSLTV